MVTQDSNNDSNNNVLKVLGLSFVITLVIILTVFSVLSFNNSMNTINDNILSDLSINSINEDVDVVVQDYNGEFISVFLTQELQLTTLSQDHYLGNTTILLTNATNCFVGDAIDIYNDYSYFQGIITVVNGNTLTITPPIDTDFLSSNTEVKCGEWNMNVDGSTTPVEFYVQPPFKRDWDIESIGMQFKDNADWDIETFRSLTALTNGFSVIIEDGRYKDLFLIYNNGGFLLRGGTIQNIEKAPSGTYGFIVDMEFETKYGAIPRLYGTNNEKMIAIIRDDLTDQEEIAFVVRGHVVED